MPSKGQKDLDEYIFTRPEVAKLLGKTTNAIRCSMRKGNCKLEYRFDGQKFLFKRLLSIVSFTTWFSSMVSVGRSPLVPPLNPLVVFP